MEEEVTEPDLHMVEPIDMPPEVNGDLPGNPYLRDEAVDVTESPAREPVVLQYPAEYSHQYGTSFIGHLAGILVGLLYTAGPLKAVMKTCAGFMTSNGYNSRPTAYYNSSGSSGYNGSYGGHSEYRQYPPNYSTASYAGGLTEEEQIEAAIRNSMSDQGQSSQRRAPPTYGFHLSEEASAEDIRLRRLRRFDS